MIKLISNLSDLKTPKEGWLIDETVFRCDALGHRALEGWIKDLQKEDHKDNQCHNYVWEYKDEILTIWDIHFPK